MYKKIVMLLLLSSQIGCSTNAVDHSRRNNVIAGLVSAGLAFGYQQGLAHEITPLQGVEEKFVLGLASVSSLLSSVPILLPQASNKIKVSCFVAGSLLAVSNLGVLIQREKNRVKKEKRSIISIVPTRKLFRKAELDADACFVCLKKLSELQSGGKHVVQSECCGNFACEEDLVEYVDHWNKAEHLNNESPACPMCKEYPWRLQPFDLEKNEVLKTGQAVMLLEKK